jgi:hypothetical protein
MILLLKHRFFPAFFHHFPFPMAFQPSFCRVQPLGWLRKPRSLGERQGEGWDVGGLASRPFDFMLGRIDCARQFMQSFGGNKNVKWKKITPFLEIWI